MKFLTMTAVAALLVGTMGALSFAPAANANDPGATSATSAPAATMAQAGSMDQQGHDTGQPGNMGHPGARAGVGPWGQQGGMRGFGQMRRQLLDIACGDRGAEALEIAFVHIKYDVKPDATQMPLFDALRTAALADQKTFANACKDAMHPAGVQPGKMTILDRLQMRLSLESAKVAALGDVVPKFKAFYDSLTDQQKAKLEPRWGQHPGMGGMMGHPGWDHQNWGRQGWPHPGQDGAKPGPQMQNHGTDQNSDGTPPPNPDNQDGSTT